MNTIYLTERDYERLHNMVQAQRMVNGTQSVEALCRELKRARVVASKEVPSDVITMNSRVRLREMRSSAEMEITIVYPKDADITHRKVSVLAPVGTAILGCRVGDMIEWPVGNGTVTYKVEGIPYQPEAAGDLLL
ncbi:nucleoside diphosphate kinase regulator [Sabulibacter ruber]|uniref:nucleoside diphosphate kinase regulator n=1 Tax=Sabulibacter ruber TaxID=2811901 RepID=UPI001A9608DD|nr:nucleoside diphosphate kinase regulator [Sabulibacter ruber]